MKDISFVIGLLSGFFAILWTCSGVNVISTNLLVGCVTIIGGLIWAVTSIRNFFHAFEKSV